MKRKCLLQLQFCVLPLGFDVSHLGLASSANPSSLVTTEVPQSSVICALSCLQYLDDRFHLDTSRLSLAFVSWFQTLHPEIDKALSILTIRFRISILNLVLTWPSEESSRWSSGRSPSKRPVKAMQSCVFDLPVNVPDRSPGRRPTSTADCTTLTENLLGNSEKLSFRGD